MPRVKQGPHIKETCLVSGCQRSSERLRSQNISSTRQGVPDRVGQGWYPTRRPAAAQAVQGVAGCVLPQALAAAGGRGRGGGGAGAGGAALAPYIGAYAPAAEAVGAAAAAAARSGGRQLRVLGEAGYKAVSARVGAWRGAAAGGLARCAPGGASERARAYGAATCAEPALWGGNSHARRWG